MATIIPFEEARMAIRQQQVFGSLTTAVIVARGKAIEEKIKARPKAKVEDRLRLAQNLWRILEDYKGSNRRKADLLTSIPFMGGAGDSTKRLFTVTWPEKLDPQKGKKRLDRLTQSVGKYRHISDKVAAALGQNPYVTLEKLVRGSSYEADVESIRKRVDSDSFLQLSSDLADSLQTVIENIGADLDRYWEWLSSGHLGWNLGGLDPESRPREIEPFQPHMAEPLFDRQPAPASRAGWAPRVDLFRIPMPESMAVELAIAAHPDGGFPDEAPDARFYRIPDPRDATRTLDAMILGANVEISLVTAVGLAAMVVPEKWQPLSGSPHIRVPAKNWLPVFERRREMRMSLSGYPPDDPCFVFYLPDTFPWLRGVQGEPRTQDGWVELWDGKSDQTGMRPVGKLGEALDGGRVFMRPKADASWDEYFNAPEVGTVDYERIDPDSCAKYLGEDFTEYYNPEPAPFLPDPWKVSERRYTKCHPTTFGSLVEENLLYAEEGEKLHNKLLDNARERIEQAEATMQELEDEHRRARERLHRSLAKGSSPGTD